MVFFVVYGPGARLGGQSLPGSGMSRALFDNKFRIRNRRNGAGEGRPINFGAETG